MRELIPFWLWKLLALRDWKLWRRQHSRALALAVLCFLILLLVIAGLQFSYLNVELSDYRMRLGQLQYDVASVASFGALTETDFNEGTTDLNTRRIGR